MPSPLRRLGPTPRSPHTSVPLWAPCARRLRPTARSAPLPGLTAAATFLLGARAPHATWQPGSLWERGPGRALLRAARWPLECPEDTASGGGRPARPAPSGRTPGPPTAVLARPGPRGTCVPGPLRCRPSARVSGDPLPPGPCADATSPRDLPDRAVREAVSPGHPERLPSSLPPHPARPGTRHPLPVSAPFPLGAGGELSFPSSAGPGPGSGGEWACPPVVWWCRSKGQSVAGFPFPGGTRGPSLALSCLRTIPGSSLLIADGRDRLPVVGGGRFPLRLLLRPVPSVMSPAPRPPSSTSAPRGRLPARSSRCARGSAAPLCVRLARLARTRPGSPPPAGASVSPRRVDPGALSSASSSALLGASAGGAQGTGPRGSAGSRPHLATRTPCRIPPLRREPRGAWLADVAPAAARGRGDLRPPCAGGGRPRVVVFPVVLHVCRVVVRRARKSGRHAPVLFLQ